MRRSTSMSPGPAPRRSRWATRLSLLCAAVLTLGLFSPAPALAAPGELVVRDGSTFEYNDASVRVVLAHRVDRPVYVSYRTVSGTALAGSDFVTTSGRLVIPAGTRVRRIAVPVVDDVRDEPNETFRVQLYDAKRALLVDRTAVVTILDDDALPVLSVGDVTGQEGATLTFEVALSRAADELVTFQYATSDGYPGQATATAAADYATTAGTGSIPAGAMSTTVAVPTAEDATHENDEAFSLTVSAVTNAMLADQLAKGAIVDDDPLPTLSMADVSVVEGRDAVLTVQLSRTSGASVVVQWVTTDGTATGSDFARSAGVLTIPAGESAGTITVRTYDDQTEEGIETFTVSLGGPHGAALADGSAVVSITDNDGPALTVADANADEGDPLGFTVTMSRPSTQPVSFFWKTADGTAKEPADYAAQALTKVTIPAGQTAVVLSVPTVADKVDEFHEMLTVVLSTPTAATLGDATATGTISDTTPTPTLTLSGPSAPVLEGQSATFTVTLSGKSQKPVTVLWSTVDGTATSGSDFNAVTDALVSFAAGELTRTFSVPIKAEGHGSNADEPAEAFKVRLSSPTHAILGTPSEVTVTIAADD